jgi:metal-responsive CopG/Arc/MetJ family transcriptional regulator
VDQNPHVETIQVVMEAELLRRIDRVARRLKVNRSALIRDALRQHLRQLQIRSREEADRHGYRHKPEEADVMKAWDGVTSWPDD